MNKRVKEFGIFFWLHLTAIIIQYSSPFLFSWKIVLIGIIAIHLQWLIFGNCVLTMMEFKTSSKAASFNRHYLSKLGIKIDPRVFSWYIGVVLPAVLLMTAIIWQVVLKHSTVF